MRLAKRRGRIPTGMAALMVDAPSGARCSCGKPAIKRLRNAWREADACVSSECQAREWAWVSNTPYSKKRPTPRSNLEPPQKSPEQLPEALFNRGLRRRFPGQPVGKKSA